MKKTLCVAALALGLAACDNSSLGDLPADNSPLAPEVNCEEPSQNDTDSALECARVEGELADNTQTNVGE